MCEGSEPTFLQGEFTNNQEVHKKMLNGKMIIREKQINSQGDTTLHPGWQWLKTNKQKILSIDKNVKKLKLIHALLVKL